MDFSSDDPIPLFLSGLQRQPDPRELTPSREAIVSAYPTALQSQTSAARTGNEVAAPSKALDTRSVTPDPVMARDCYHNAPGFGSADAQQRLTQLRS
jgi:hypothetical protein